MFMDVIFYSVPWFIYFSKTRILKKSEGSKGVSFL